MDNCIRPIPGRIEAPSFSFANQSESAAILTYLLNNNTPEELHARISAAVHSRMMLPQEVDRLLSSLKTVGVLNSAASAAASDETVRHCVRCHSTCMERDNGFRACRVPHDSPRLVCADENGVPVFMNYYPCLQKSLSTGVVLLDWHDVQRHTTMAHNVNYNGTNVTSCQQRQCAAPAQNRVLPPANGDA